MHINSMRIIIFLSSLPNNFIIYSKKKKLASSPISLVPSKVKFDPEETCFEILDTMSIHPPRSTLSRKLIFYAIMTDLFFENLTKSPS